MLSTLVFTLSRLKYFTAMGLVKNNNVSETSRNRITCTKIGAYNRAAKMATSAPAANHIVVSPRVRTSITMHRINMTIQKISTISIQFSSPCPFSLNPFHLVPKLSLL